MIAPDLQGMSPKPATVLEGEVNGPSYGATTAPPGLHVDTATGSGLVMNGAGVSEGEPQLSEVQATVLPSMTASATVGASDFLNASVPVNRDDHGQPTVAEVPSENPGMREESIQDAARVDVGGYNFSPPEALPPEPQPQSSSSNQVMWFARIGEFVQRRVAQASMAMNPILEPRQHRSSTQVLSTPSPRVPRLFTPEAEQTMAQWARRAPHLYSPEQRAQEESSSTSLTQDQIMMEVQKQVRSEMRVHYEERQALQHENNQLKEMLEKVLERVQARGLDGGDHDVRRGTSLGPQGSVPEANVDGRGGNLGGLCERSSRAGEDLPKAQPDPGQPAPPPVLQGGPRDSREDVPRPGGDPLGAWLPLRSRRPGEGGAQAMEHPAGGGQPQQRPLGAATTNAGAGVQAGQVLQRRVR